MNQKLNFLIFVLVLEVVFHLTFLLLTQPLWQYYNSNSHEPLEEILQRFDYLEQGMKLKEITKIIYSMRSLERKINEK